MRTLPRRRFVMFGGTHEFSVSGNFADLLDGDVVQETQKVVENCKSRSESPWRLSWDRSLSGGFGWVALSTLLGLGSDELARFTSVAPFMKCAISPRKAEGDLKPWD